MTFTDPAKTEATLFHYTNAAGLVGIIKNRELWATESNYLNDPTEVSFAAKVLVGLLQQRLESEDTNERARAQAVIALLEGGYVDPHSPDQYREDRSYISSFSRSDQSLTLWRLYGGRNGFSIGFDDERLLQWVGHELPSQEREGLSRVEQEERDGHDANYLLDARIQDVVYGANHVAPFLDEVMAVPNDDENPFRFEALLRGVLSKLSSIKHEAYEDEREARMIVQELHHHAIDPSVRVSAAGALVAYRKVVFPFEAVQSITMAPGANAAQTRRAILALSAQGGRGPYSHVEIREYDLPFVW